jgi:hypothetical protein
MTFRKTFSSIFALILVVGVIWFSLPPKRNEAHSLTETRAEKHSGVLKIPSHSWNNVSKSDLEGYAEFFSKQPNRTITEFETLVAEGETVITQGIEIEPGVFMFSDLTPRMKTGRNGSPAMFLEARTFQIDVAGENKESFSEAVELEGSETIWEISIGYEKFAHTLDIRANQNTNFPLVKMSAKSYLSQIHKGKK